MASPIDAFVAAAKAPGRILICAHEKPDGDALGSLGGLLRILRDNGVEADAVVADEIPSMYASFLPEGLLCSVSPESLKSYSRAILLDISNPKRLSVGPALKFETFSIPTLCLDHHPDNNVASTYSWVDPKASSTSELALRLAEAASWRVGKEAATLLMMGLAADTGCFRFDNSSPTAFRAAAKLIELGADFSRIVRDVYFSKPIGLASLEADLLCNHLGQAFEGRLAYFMLTPEILAKHAVQLRDTENVIDVLRALKGVEFAAILRPVADGWKLSLRSKTPAFSAGRIARRLEGGGHEMAAGGLIRAASAEDAIRILIENVEIEFNEAQARQASSSPL